MRAIIVANGIFSSQLPTEAGDLIIAANGGVRHCLDFGLKPSVAIGDFDSLSDNDIQELNKLGTKLVQYPARKDSTDLELAIKFAAEKGVDHIIILAALGSRWDQTIANILLPIMFPHIKLSLIDGTQEIHYIHNGQRLVINGQSGDTVSLIPLCGNASGITIDGFEYPMDEDRLFLGSTRGISNVLTGSSGSIFVKNGILLCSIIHKDKQPEIRTGGNW